MGGRHPKQHAERRPLGDGGLHGLRAGDTLGGAGPLPPARRPRRPRRPRWLRRLVAVLLSVMWVRVPGRSKKHLRQSGSRACPQGRGGRPVCPAQVHGGSFTVAFPPRVVCPRGPLPIGTAPPRPASCFATPHLPYRGPWLSRLLLGLV